MDIRQRNLIARTFNEQIIPIEIDEKESAEFAAIEKAIEERDARNAAIKVTADDLDVIIETAILMGNDNIAAQMAHQENHTNVCQTIVNGGLYSTGENDVYFSHLGCDVCIHPMCKGLPGNVMDASGYASLEDSRNGDLYEFRICELCNYYAEYGEE